MTDNISARADLTMKRYEVEDAEQWREWIGKIPFLSFPASWEVRVMPPFGGAMIRFTAKRGDASVSVYLDVFGRLGYMPGPYWEIYPYEDDTWRCAMEGTEELISAIEKALTEQEQ